MYGANWILNWCFRNYPQVGTSCSRYFSRVMTRHILVYCLRSVFAGRYTDIQTSTLGISLQDWNRTFLGDAWWSPRSHGYCMSREEKKMYGANCIVNWCSRNYLQVGTSCCSYFAGSPKKSWGWWKFTSRVMTCHILVYCLGSVSAWGVDRYSDYMSPRVECDWKMQRSAQFLRIISGTALCMTKFRDQLLSAKWSWLLLCHCGAYKSIMTCLNEACSCAHLEYWILMLAILAIWNNSLNLISTNLKDISLSLKRFLTGEILKNVKIVYPPNSFHMKIAKFDTAKICCYTVPCADVWQPWARWMKEDKHYLMIYTCITQTHQFYSLPSMADTEGRLTACNCPFQLLHG